MNKPVYVKLEEAQAHVLVEEFVFDASEIIAWQILPMEEVIYFRQGLQMKFPVGTLNFDILKGVMDGTYDTSLTSPRPVGRGTAQEYDRAVREGSKVAEKMAAREEAQRRRATPVIPAQLQGLPAPPTKEN